MTVKLLGATADAMNDAVSALMNGGSIQIRSGSQPATAATAASGTLLATLTLDSTPMAASSGGVASFNDLPLSVTAAATGTAGWFRVLKSGGGTIYDGACGTSLGAGVEMALSTTSLVAGVAVTLTIASHTMPLS